MTVSYRLAIGLAVSEDGGQTYRRYSSGPLLDRDRDEPFFNTDSLRAARAGSLADVVQLLYRLD